MSNEIDPKFVDNLLEENQRLRTWIDDLQSGMYINCVYCGHRYGPKDEVPATKAQVLKDHIEMCPKHPMFKLRIKLHEVEKQNKELERGLSLQSRIIDSQREETTELKSKLKFKDKVLAVIEGIRLLDESDGADKEDHIYSFAHIGTGTCKNQHLDWHKELDEIYTRLTEDGVIGERGEGVLEQVEQALDWCRKVNWNKKRRKR